MNASKKPLTLPLFFACALFSCSNDSAELIVGKDTFNDENAISPSVQVKAAFLDGEFEGPDAATSAKIKVETSLCNAEGKGFRISEEIRNEKDGNRVFSSFSISAHSQTGKSVSFSGSLIFRQSKEIATATINEKAYLLSLPGTNAALLSKTTQAKEFASAIPTGKAESITAQASIRVGYSRSGNLAANLERPFESSDKNGHTKWIDSNSFVYEKHETVLRLIHHAVYYSSECKNDNGTYFATASVSSDFGYDPVRVEGDVDEKAPSGIDFVYGASSTGFCVLPYLDVSSLFEDGTKTYAVGSYVNGFQSSFGNFGSLQEGLICGKSGTSVGPFQIFYSRLSSVI